MSNVSYSLLDLSLLASKAEWRIIKIEHSVDEVQERELDDVLCCCLEEEAHHLQLDEIS